MADNWYYVQGGTRQGPATTEALQGMVASGQLSPKDQVWKDGMSGWVPISQAPEFAGSVPHAANPPAAPSVPGGPPALGVMAGPPEVFDKMARILRIWLIIAAGLLVVTFFTPYYYASASPPVVVGEQNVAAVVVGPLSSVLFGWNFWWGILAFVFGFLALAAAILSLVMQRMKIMQVITKWVSLGAFSVAALVSFLGTLLGVFGIGIAVYEPGAVDARGAGDGWITFSDIRTREAQNHIVAAGKASLVSFPITASLVVLAAGLGLTISLMIVTKKKISMGKMG